MPVTPVSHNSLSSSFTTQIAQAPSSFYHWITAKELPCEPTFMQRIASRLTGLPTHRERSNYERAAMIAARVSALGAALVASFPAAYALGLSCSYIGENLSNIPVIQSPESIQDTLLNNLSYMGATMTNVGEASCHLIHKSAHFAAYELQTALSTAANYTEKLVNALKIN